VFERINRSSGAESKRKRIGFLVVFQSPSEIGNGYGHPVRYVAEIVRHYSHVSGETFGRVVYFRLYVLDVYSHRYVQIFVRKLQYRFAVRQRVHLILRIERSEIVIRYVGVFYGSYVGHHGRESYYRVVREPVRVSRILIAYVVYVLCAHEHCGEFRNLHQTCRVPVYGRSVLAYCGIGSAHAGRPSAYGKIQKISCRGAYGFRRERIRRRIGVYGRSTGHA